MSRTYRVITWESEDPHQLRDKIISRMEEEYSEELDTSWEVALPKVVGEERVVSRSQPKKLIFPEGSSTIPHKFDPELSDHVSRLSYSWSHEGASVTLYKVGEGVISEIENIGSEDRLSDFQFEYLYLKYNFKMRQEYNEEREFGKYESIEELYSDYDLQKGSSTSAYGYYSVENRRGRFKIAKNRSRDLNSDFTHKADRDTLDRLAEYFSDKGLSINPSSMLENFMISTGYVPETAYTSYGGKPNLEPIKVPADKLVETFSDKEFNQYLGEVIEAPAPSSHKYSDRDFMATEKIGGERNENIIPDPKKVRDTSAKIHLNSRCSGEFQVVISLKGDTYLEDFSEKFNFILLTSYSWISENLEKELEEIQKIIETN